MSQRFSGWVGAVVLLALAVSTACGSRDNLFVNDDLANPNAGGSSGSVSFGGRAGFGAGGLGHAGAGGSAGFGGAFAFGGSTGFGGFSGMGVGGFAAAGGTSSFSCAACFASAGPCTVATCDVVNELCRLAPKADGATCGNGDLCAGAGTCRTGVCVVGPAVACPPPSACSHWVCDQTTGQCVDQPLNGGGCDSGNPCSIGECMGGVCQSGALVTACQGGDQCCPAGCSSSTDSDCAGPRQIKLDSTDRGWYDDSGFHDMTMENTFTGFSGLAYYNSFFVFDLSTVNGTIQSVQFLLEEENFYGTAAQETASIWDVSESSATLAMTNQTPSIFQDLQSGNQYGSFVGTAADIGRTFTIALNAKAVADLNAARGSTFSLGVHIDGLEGQVFGNAGLRFSEGSELRTEQLVLQVQ